MRIDDGKDDQTLYKVLVNHEEQYSIWPADRVNPDGWNDSGKTGSKSECLAYIGEVWTDRRPRSLRESMEFALGVPLRDPEAGPNKGCPV